MMQTIAVSPAEDRIRRSRRLTQWTALGLALSTYLLMVLGALVRSMDAGLACPDWPLCHGQWFPPFEPVLSEGGAVPTPAQMNAEWFHRLAAAMVSGGSLLLAYAAWRTRDARIKKYTIVAAILLTVQILMGAATVLLGNIHYSVAIHLALATGFLVSLTWIARLAAGAGALRRWLPGPALVPALRRQGWWATLTLFTLLMLGAIIATTPGADLVCPSFPHCGRDDYSWVGWLVTLQMAHRLIALGFLAWVLALALGVRQVPELRGGAWLLAGLTLLQVTLGIVNVFWSVPAAISTAHLATAVAMFMALFHFTAPEPAEVK